MLEISLTVSLLIIAAFFVGIGIHRSSCNLFFITAIAAHMQFTISKFWQKVFYIFSYVSQGSSYLSPRAYAIMHRLAPCAYRYGGRPAFAKVYAQAAYPDVGNEKELHEDIQRHSAGGCEIPEEPARLEMARPLRA